MKTLVLVLILLYSVFGFGQTKKEQRYYLNNHLNIVGQEQATIVGKGNTENGLFKLDCYSIGEDTMLLTAHFKDSSLTQFHGLYTAYYPTGNVYVRGSYKANLKEGLWQYWDTLGYKTDSVLYVWDMEALHALFEYHEEGQLLSARITDNVNNTFQETLYGKAGNIIEKVEFKGEKGIRTSYRRTGIATELLFTRKEKMARFPDSAYGSDTYIQQNIDFNVPINNKAPSGIYDIFIVFDVNDDGVLFNIKAKTNYGYGMEDEAIRIVRKSPKWIPAMQYGQIIQGYGVLMVTFVVR